MNTLQIKNNIIQKISQIDNVTYLNKINDLVNTIHKSVLENTKKSPSLKNNRSIDNNDKENFNDYIKEWLKEM